MASERGCPNWDLSSLVDWVFEGIDWDDPCSIVRRVIVVPEADMVDAVNAVVIGRYRMYRRGGVEDGGDDGAGVGGGEWRLYAREVTVHRGEANVEEEIEEDEDGYGDGKVSPCESRRRSSGGLGLWAVPYDGSGSASDIPPHCVEIHKGMPAVLLKTMDKKSYRAGRVVVVDSVVELHALPCPLECPLVHVRVPGGVAASSTTCDGSTEEVCAGMLLPPVPFPLVDGLETKSVRMQVPLAPVFATTLELVEERVHGARLFLGMKNAEGFVMERVGCFVGDVTGEYSVAQIEAILGRVVDQQNFRVVSLKEGD